MIDLHQLLDRTILVGGPPRSGTTFAAKSLNLHPRIITAIDDHVYECWGLYQYRNRAGLVDSIRTSGKCMNKEAAHHILHNALFDDDSLRGVGPSPKTLGCRVVPYSRSRPDFAISELDLALERHIYPLDRFESDWFLCLKSPEISHVLPQLAEYFPSTRFVLVYRPIIEIAESMFRAGEQVKVYPIFHKRWSKERGEQGQLLPPPGIPQEWSEFWHEASDFQRCVIYAAGYVRGIVEGTKRLPKNRYFLYDHSLMRSTPDVVFQHIANFLGIDVIGFQFAITQIQTTHSFIQPEFTQECMEIDELLSLAKLTHEIVSLMTPKPLFSNNSPMDSQI